MRRVAACACVEPIVKASVMTFSMASERKQIGQKVALLGRRQRRAIDVAIIAVADEPRIEAEPFRGLLSRIAGGRDETAVACVYDIETPHEGGWPLRRRLQQVAQRRNGAIVEVWPIEPQSAQRLRDVAWDLAEGFETPIAAFAEIVIGVAGKLGPHMRPVDVGADLGDRNHGERALAVGGVTLGAVGRKYDLATFEGRSVRPVRRWWWRQRAQEAVDTLHCGEAELARNGAVTECRADHHLSHRVVQAIPMQRCRCTNLLA